MARGALLSAFRSRGGLRSAIRARSLLFEGELSIENVAYASGFSSLSQFYEQFRAAYGVTPREMRAKYLHGI